MAFLLLPLAGSRSAPPQATVLAPHDVALVTALENTTGNPVIDGMVEDVLRQELKASPVQVRRHSVCATPWC